MKNKGCFGVKPRRHGALGDEMKLFVSTVHRDLSRPPTAVYSSPTKTQTMRDWNSSAPASAHLRSSPTKKIAPPLLSPSYIIYHYPAFPTRTRTPLSPKFACSPKPCLRSQSIPAPPYSSPLRPAHESSPAAQTAIAAAGSPCLAVDYFLQPHRRSGALFLHWHQRIRNKRGCFAC